LSSEAKGVLAAVVTALSWSVLAIGLKYILYFTTPGNTAWARMFIAATAMVFFYVARDRSALEILKRPPPLVVVAGACLALNYLGFMKGIEHTSAGNTQIMIQSAPMALILIGIFFFKEVPSVFQAIGFVSALIGFGFFYWDQWLQTLATGKPLLLGNLWILMAAATWAVFATITKTLSSKYEPQHMNLLIYVVSAVALLPLLEPSGFAPMTPLAWSLLFVFGLNTILAYGCLGYALKNAPASKVSVIVSANPLLTLVILYFMSLVDEKTAASEKIALTGYIGAGLVVVGVILAAYTPQKKIRT